MELKACGDKAVEHQGDQGHEDKEAWEEHPEDKSGDDGEGGDDYCGSLLFAFDIVLHGFVCIVSPAKVRSQIDSF